MDTKVIEVNKNIIITQRITDPNVVSFHTNINNVNFIPDVVIVKMITFNSAEALPTGGAGALTATPYNQVFNIYTNLVDDGFIGSFTDVGSNYPNISLLIKKPIKGQYLFQLLNPSNIAVNFIGDITIHLDFIKYKEVREGKIY